MGLGGMKIPSGEDSTISTVQITIKVIKCGKLIGEILKPEWKNVLRSKSTRTRPLGRPSQRLEENFRRDLKEMGINTKN